MSISKKKKFILYVIIIVALILIIAAGYTFSKYYEAISGTAGTNIAAWSFNANAGDNKKLAEIVLEGANGEKIAPGSKGKFQIKVDNIGSDVDVDYKVEITEEKLPANMKFYIEKDSVHYTSMAALASVKLKGSLTEDHPSDTYTIVWDWPFESYDEYNNILDSKDLTVGTDVAQNVKYGFKINVIGEQN